MAPEILEGIITKDSTFEEFTYAQGLIKKGKLLYIGTN